MIFSKLKIERILCLVIVITLLTVFFILAFGNNKIKSQTNNDEIYDKMLLLLEESINFAKYNFTDLDNSKSFQTLFYGAIKGLYKATGNKWTHFYDEEEWDRLWERLSGKLVGIGVYVIEDRYRKGVPYIVEPIVDSPAYKSGIIARDKIIKIEGIPTEGNDYRENLDRITGAEGTEISLTIERTINQTMEIKLIRKEIKILTVQYEMIDEEIAYIKLRRFSSETDKDLSKALTELSLQGMKKLIIDLRNNPGGLLDVCVNICDKFIDSGIILTTKGRKNSDNRKFIARKSNTVYKDKPLIILVNENSASASEIFSGAMKDHKKAILIGTQTYGKGMVANVSSLNSSSSSVGVSIVIQKYFTPNGTDINDIGIEPNIIIENQKHNDDDIFYLKKILYYNDNEDLIYNFVKNNKLFSEEDLKSFHSLLINKGLLISYYALKNEVIAERDRYKLKLYSLNSDNQLQKAIELIRSMN